MPLKKESSSIEAPSIIEVLGTRIVQGYKFVVLVSWIFILCGVAIFAISWFGLQPAPLEFILNRSVANFNIIIGVFGQLLALFLFMAQKL
jgi:hypothetical protein